MFRLGGFGTDIQGGGDQALPDQRHRSDLGSDLGCRADRRCHASAGRTSETRGCDRRLRAKGRGCRRRQLLGWAQPRCRKPRRPRLLQPKLGELIKEPLLQGWGSAARPARRGDRRHADPVPGAGQFAGRRHAPAQRAADRRTAGRCTARSRGPPSGQAQGPGARHPPDTVRRRTAGGRALCL